MTKETTTLTPDSLGLENKDLTADLTRTDPTDTPVEDEVEADETPAVARLDGIEVKMLHHYTHEGSNLLPGAVVVLPETVAWRLVANHYAKYE